MIYPLLLFSPEILGSLFYSRSLIYYKEMLRRTTMIGYWLVLFLIMNLMLPHVAGGNESARMAMLASMSRKQTFQIIHYQWTQDWSRTPDGKLYSNKPPGPAFAALPFFWVIDQLPHELIPSLDAPPTDGKEYSVIGHILSLLMQVLPFGLLTYLLARDSKNQSVPSTSYMVLGLLFGTTAALLMNTYFGHAFASWCLLGMAYGLLKKNYYLVGFFSGWALLSDYGGLVVLPFVILELILFARPRFTAFKQLILGSIVPAGLWIWYHWTAFGTPFTLATKFASAEFKTSSSAIIWGLFSLPNMSFVGELIYGQSRGLLFTQPWILVLILFLPFLPWRKIWQECAYAVSLVVIAVPSLVLLIIMNSSFITWEGGWDPGPRYISLVLPLFAVIAGLLYPYFSKVQKFLLWVALIISLALFGLVYTTIILIGPDQSIWLTTWNYLAANHAIYTSSLLAMFFLAVIWGISESWGDKKDRAIDQLIE